jgi:hypothetical protein
MEGGKLAAGDEKKYKSMLPKAGDSSERARLKTQQAIRFLDSLRDNRLKALKSGGYRVEGGQPAVRELPSGDLEVDDG